MNMNMNIYEYVVIQYSNVILEKLSQKQAKVTHLAIIFNLRL